MRLYWKDNEHSEYEILKEKEHYIQLARSTNTPHHVFVSFRLHSHELACPPPICDRTNNEMLEEGIILLGWMKQESSFLYESICINVSDGYFGMISEGFMIIMAYRVKWIICYYKNLMIQCRLIFWIFVFFYQMYWAYSLWFWSS